MRLRLTVPEQNTTSLMEKLNDWNVNIVARDRSGSQFSIVSMNIYYKFFEILLFNHSLVVIITFDF